jgi:hypothetical protein
MAENKDIFERIKAPRSIDRKTRCIELIQRVLRSSIRGSFHAAEICLYFLRLALPFILLTGLEGHETSFKLYCFYTPFFQPLYKDYFLPSLKDEFEVIALECPEECPSGLFKSQGWDRVMFRKLQILRQAIQDHMDRNIFFYSDIDIIFLRPIIDASLRLLGDHDFVIQQGWPHQKLCAGFIVMRGSPRTLKLINTAIDLMERGICLDDQKALRRAIQIIAPNELSWTFLPPLQFPNGNRVFKEEPLKRGSHYSKDKEIKIDDSILLFHANCCIGLENKIDFLLRIQEEFNGKNSGDFLMR